MNTKKIFEILKNKYVVFFAVFILGLLIRVKYSSILPVTNDEGAYLYDTLNIRNGLIPLKDFLTKSLPFIYLLNFSQQLFGNSLFIARMTISFFSLIAAVYLYRLTDHFFGRKVAFISVMFFWAFPLIAAYTTLVHTEPLQIALILISYYYLVRYLESKASILFLVASALGMGLAFFVRQSSVVAIIWPVAFALLYFRKKDLFKKTFAFFVSTMGVISTILYFFINTLGFHKSLELIGMGAVNLSIAQKSTLGLKKLILFPLDFASGFLSEASNLYRDGQVILIFILLSFIFYIFSKLDLSRNNKFKYFNIVILLTLGLIFVIQSKFNLYSGRWKIDAIVHFDFALFALTLILFSISRALYTYKDKKIADYAQVFMSGWLLALVGIYLIWIKFRSPYLIEFFPPLLILMGHGMVTFFENLDNITNNIFRIYVKNLALSAIVLSFVGSYFFNEAISFTGLHTTRDLKEVSQYLKESSSDEDWVLTASAIFPYVSGDRVLYDISHPAWYGYKDIGPETLHLYFPPYSDIEYAIENQIPKYVIRDQFTDESYFPRWRGGGAVEKLYENYTIVKSVGRASIYQRNSDLDVPTLRDSLQNPIE